MAKIQLTLSDNITDILDKLRKFDKAPFVEMAIREALKNPELIERFIWKEPIVDMSDIQKNVTTGSVTDGNIRKKIVIDNDFK